MRGRTAVCTASAVDMLKRLGVLSLQSVHLDRLLESRTRRQEMVKPGAGPYAYSEDVKVPQESPHCKANSVLFSETISGDW